MKLANLFSLHLQPATTRDGADLSLSGYALNAARQLGSLLRAPANSVPEAVNQLYDMADAYEATQPSYAADLRHAAMRATGQNAYQ